MRREKEYLLLVTVVRTSHLRVYCTAAALKGWFGGAECACATFFNDGLLSGVYLPCFSWFSSSFWECL